MDAREYLRELMASYVATHEQGGSAHIDLPATRHELRGAAKALARAGRLEPSEIEEVMDEYDTLLSDRGHIRQVTSSASMFTTAEARATSASQPAERKPSPSQQAEIRAVVPAVQAVGQVRGHDLTALSLELWSHASVFHFHIADDQPGRGTHDLFQSVRWEASDDLGNVYQSSGSGGSSAPGGIRGHVRFVPGLFRDASRLVVRTRGDDGPMSAIIDIVS